MGRCKYCDRCEWPDCTISQEPPGYEEKYFCHFNNSIECDYAPHCFDLKEKGDNYYKGCEHYEESEEANV